MEYEIPYIESRLFKILSMCIEKDICNIDLIASELDVTNRSIRNYVKQLNNDLGEDIAQLCYHKGKGYSLDVYNEEVFEIILEKNKQSNISLNSREDRVRFILEYLIDLKGVTTLDQLADEMCVSRTTLVNDFKVVKKILKTFSLNLINKQNTGMRLDEDELNIRLLILNYIYKEYRSDFSQSLYYDIINEDDLDKIKKIVLSLLKERKYYATKDVFQETINYIILMIYRIKENKKISSYEKKCEILISYEEYYIAKDIKIRLESEFGYVIDDKEIIFLTLPLVSGNAPSIENSVNSNYNIKPIEELMNKIIEEIYLKTKIVVDDEELRTGLGYHLRFTLNRLLFNINMKNILLDDIKENYTLAYNIAKIAASVIEREYEMIVSEDEIGYIALHFGSYLERNNYNLNKIKKIALVCETGLGTTKLLEIRLKKLLRPDIIIHSYSIIKLRSVNLDEYDVILTTTNLDVSTNRMILKIDVIFDEYKLKKQLENLFSLEGNNTDLSITSNLLAQIISNTEQFMILNNDNIIDCIDDMLDNLIEFQYINPKFKDKVKERELQYPTAFDNGLLLPHAVYDDAEELSLAIGILENSITYNDKNIKIIVMLIIPPEEKIDSDLLVKVYDDLLKIGQDTKTMDSICKCRSFYNFKRIISEKVI